MTSSSKEEDVGDDGEKKQQDQGQRLKEDESDIDRDHHDAEDTEDTDDDEQDLDKTQAVEDDDDDDDDDEKAGKETTAATTQKRPAHEEAEEATSKDKAAAAESDSTTHDSNNNSNSNNTAKRAKIAMPPAVAPSLMDVDEYKVETGEDDDVVEQQCQQNHDTVDKITNPSLILFGLHPLIKEGPLKKTLQQFGNVESMTVRSAFASRYGSVTFSTTAEAQSAYKALNGFSIFHKKMLVQPGVAQQRQQQEQEK